MKLFALAAILWVQLWLQGLLPRACTPEPGSCCCCGPATSCSCDCLPEGCDCSLTDAPSSETDLLCEPTFDWQASLPERVIAQPVAPEERVFVPKVRRFRLPYIRPPPLAYSRRGPPLTT